LSGDTADGRRFRVARRGTKGVVEAQPASDQRTALLGDALEPASSIPLDPRQPLRGYPHCIGIRMLGAV
jgi:hypothetical protein